MKSSTVRSIKSEWQAEQQEACRNTGTTLSTMKARQVRKIRQLGDALIASGSLTLDQQANTLGLSRSTSWSILRANHKSSGLSATVINRMLSTPNLPALVRSRILEYVEEKLTGTYGHGKTQRMRFLAQISSSCTSKVSAQPLEPRKKEQPSQDVVLPIARTN
jgi:hypothetical protein